MRLSRAVRRTLVVLVAIVFAPCVGLAQDIRLEERPRPEAPQGPAGVPPGHDTTARPPASGVPARDVRVEHDPAFVEPFVGIYETPAGSGQFGLSGWTSPNAPAGPVFRDLNGWFSFGFTFTWGGKPVPPASTTQ